MFGQCFFIEYMKKHWDNVSDYVVENSQIKKHGLTHMMYFTALFTVADAFRKLWIVFEYVLQTQPFFD